MKVSKKVNAVRRSLMHSLTKDVGKDRLPKNLAEKTAIKKVLITRPNHRLGNLLIITPLVQEVISFFPESKIDLFVKGGVSPSVFKNYRNIDRIIQLPKKPFSNLFKYLRGWFLLKTKKYDLVINATAGSSSGRLSTNFARSHYKLFSDQNMVLQEKFPDYRHSAKNSIYNLRDYLAKLGFENSAEAVPDLDIKLDRPEIEKGKEQLNAITKNDKKTICLFTNATGAKCYSEEWWEKFYDTLHRRFPDYNIIEMLPVENISKLNFKIPHFYSKDIREMGGFIANVDVFIAADSGVMHLASASGVPTVGLFSVSEESVYRPYNPGSFSVNTASNDHEQIATLLSETLNRRK